MNPHRLLLLLALWLPCTGLVSAQEVPDNAMDLVYLRSTTPVLVRLQFQMGDQSLQQRWEAYVTKWFHYLDRDHNSLLNAAEIQFAPKSVTLAQLFRQGTFFINQGSTLKLADLGKNAEESINLADLLAYYRKGAGPVQFINNNNPAGMYDQVNSALVKALDTNQDGILSRPELENSWTALTRLDLDDDETVVTQEIAPNFNQFGFRAGFSGNPAANQPNSPFFALVPGAPRGPLGAFLLTKFDKDKNGRLSRAEINLVEATFARLDLNQDGGLDAEELSRLPDRTPDYLWDVRLGKNPGGTTWSLHKAGIVLPGTVIALDDVEISLKTMDANLAAIRGNAGLFYQQQFRQADKDNRGYVELADLQNPQSQFLKLLFPLLDQNNDSKLTFKELQIFTDLQTEAMSCQVSASISEQGRTLFQVLDVNRDGRLTQREMGLAWKRLQFIDRKNEVGIAADEIPRQFQILFGQGPQALVVQPGFGAMNPPPIRAPVASSSPLWFRKMDVNGDGDVSFREFLGTRAEFQRLDTDGDGLLDPTEALSPKR